MPRELLPIADVIRIKRRPETTLTLKAALEDPRQTVDDYVFTGANRDHFHRILRQVQDERGKAFWVKGEYGGGKTHFLATLAALLEGDEQVWSAVHDDLVQNLGVSIRQRLLFPVVFSLRGQGEAGGSRRTLLDVLEEEIDRAAVSRLGRSIDLNAASELLKWYEECGRGTKADLDGAILERRGATLTQIRNEGGNEAAAGALREAAAALGLRPQVAASTESRLRRAYDLLVRDSGQYKGLLVIMDEFAFWQDLHPEGGRAYAADEEVLETLGWQIPRDQDLPIYVIVASQKDPPVKLRGDRFELLDVLSGESAEAKVRDYQRIVSHRVREIRPDRRVDAQLYAQHYRDVFDQRFADEDQFLDAFPIEQHAYEILQLLTQSLASERVGINVVWEVLGRTGSDGKPLEGPGGEPVPTAMIQQSRSLIVAADLLQSRVLNEELRGYQFAAALRARDQLLASLERSGPGEELPPAERIAQTLFLWYVANRQAPRPMLVQQLAEATLLESEELGSPRNATEYYVGRFLAPFDQIEFNPTRGEVAFKVVGTDGPQPAEIFNDILQRPIDPYKLNEFWREALTSTDLRVSGNVALFDSLAPEMQPKGIAEYGRVEYPGEYLLTREWAAKLANLPGDRSRHWRVVFLTDPSELEPELIHDPRIAVVVPGSRNADHDEALGTYAAYRVMQRDFSERTDPEALACKAWLAEPATRSRLIEPLLRVQRDVYRAGEIVSRDSVAIDPRNLFTGVTAAPRLATQIAERLLEHAYAGRPFQAPAAPQPIKGQVPGQIFAGLFNAQPAKAASDAVKNYAPTLGLSLPGNPVKLDAGASRVFEHVRTMLDTATSQNSPGVYGTQLYDHLYRLGLTDDLTSLYLLAFVFSPAENAELHLRAKSKVKLESGGTVPESRIAGATVRQIDFGSVSPNEIDLLARRKEVSWNDALPLMQQFDGKLTASMDPDQIADKERVVLGEVEQVVKGSEAGIKELRDAAMLMGQAVPVEAWSQAELAARFAEINSFQALYERAGEVFEGDKARLAAMVREAHNLDVLRASITDLRTAFTWLKDPSMDRLDPVLRVAAIGLREQLRLDDLSRQPSRCPQILADFEEFRKRYTLEYTVFLRDWFAGADKARDSLRLSEQKLRALENLEQMLSTVAPQAAEFRRRLQAAEADLPSMEFDASAVDVRSGPVCAHHGVPYGAALPNGPVQALDAELDRVLEARLATLRGDTVRRLLRDPGTQPARRVVAALGTQNDANWIKLLADDALAHDVAAVIHSIVTREVPVLAALRSQFPTITRANLDQATAAFRHGLEDAITQAEAGREPDVAVEITLQ